MRARAERRVDPGRRERIIDAALDVIVEHGVAGTTHRRVAAAADVPLGSLTYHFEGLEDLLNASFERFTSMMAEVYLTRLKAASCEDEARGAVVDLLCGEGVLSVERNMILSYELYAYAIRQPKVRTVWVAWMAESRRALEQFFSPQVSRALDAMMEGVSIHNYARTNILPREEITEIIDALTR